MYPALSLLLAGGPMSGKRSAASLTLIPCLLALIGGCDTGGKSRFDEVAGVDVCQLITTAEAEHILGPLQGTEPGAATGQGIAGECTWSFRVLATNGQGTLYAMMTTRASSPHGPSPTRFFRISQAEVEASLGASPWEMRDLGDRAVLYQTRRPDHSELWLLQSETLFMLRMLGGSAAQLEQFARALARELEPQQ
jgi:hypothetical protein